MTEAPDFGLLAARYDELRPADEGWWELTEALVREGDLRGQRVLDVGCGTGTFASVLAERFGAKVWGVDPSEEMLAVARRKAARGVGFKQGRAEELPFRESWFERGVMRLSVHLVDRPRAFAELRRVLAARGRLAIETFDPAHFGTYWLNEYFPSICALDRLRFPNQAVLRDELAAAGFALVGVTPLRVERTLDREAALERIRGRHISTFQLIDEEEYDAGLERAEAELPDRVESTAEVLIVVANR